MRYVQSRQSMIEQAKACFSSADVLRNLALDVAWCTPPPRFPPPRRRKSVAWHPERRIRKETSVPSSANIHNISISISIYHFSYSIYFNFRLQSTSRWLHYSSYPRGIWQCSGNCVQNWVFNSPVIKISRLCQPSAQSWHCQQVW